jgi:predicted dehydrogenase
MLAAMRAGKYASTEMPACLGIEEGWELVETSERTGLPCMLMENYCYMRHLQMILNNAFAGPEKAKTRRTRRESTKNTTFLFHSSLKKPELRIAHL